MHTTQTPEVLLQTHGRQKIISVRQTVAVSDVQTAQLDSLRQLWAFTQRQHTDPAGAPFVRYHTFGPDETDVEVGIPGHSRGVERTPGCRGRVGSTDRPPSPRRRLPDRCPAGRLR